MSKQHSNHLKAANMAAIASTEALTTSTLTTSADSYWIVASTSASSSDWFIDCRCMTHNTGCRSMFITYTKYFPNTIDLNGNNGVTSFAAGYGNV
jgi:hypothetical protein